MPTPTFYLTLGAVVGIVLSGGFVWWQVGRYATPQVPVTRFDERKELLAYTAGLFVGVPLAVSFVLFLTSMSNGALPGAALFLALLVGGTETAQWGLLRSRYWGTGPSGPFYALGYRAAIGGIVALALVTDYLATPGLAALDVGLVLFWSATIVALEAAGALLSLRSTVSRERTGGGPFSGAVVGAGGFFLIGLGAIAGDVAAFGGAAVALVGGVLVYRRLRPLLDELPPPGAGPKAPPPSGRVSYGRTDRKAPSSNTTESPSRRD